VKGKKGMEKKERPVDRKNPSIAERRLRNGGKPWKTKDDCSAYIKAHDPKGLTLVAAKDFLKNS